MTDRVFNVFQAVAVVLTAWFIVLGIGLLIVGCATPPPVVRTPDIVEIAVPTPVLGNFGCQCACECEPNKELEIKVEEALEFPYLEGTPR